MLHWLHHLLQQSETCYAVSQADGKPDAHHTFGNMGSQCAQFNQVMYTSSVDSSVSLLACTQYMNICCIAWTVCYVESAACTPCSTDVKQLHSAQLWSGAMH